MSLTDIEKNDIDISQLFNYGKKVTLLSPTTQDEFDVYLRIIGDADNNRARVFALRESAKLRANLKNTRWEDRIAYIPDTSKLKKDELVDLVLSLIVQELSIKSLNETTLHEPKQPGGDATLEEQEKYQEEIDKYRETFAAMVAELLQKKLEEHRKTLNKNTKEELKNLYELAAIDKHCQDRFNDSYIEMATFYGLYNDEHYKYRLFKTFEDFRNIPTHLKVTLIDEYRSLQIGTMTLKKSQGVTP